MNNNENVLAPVEENRPVTRTNTRLFRSPPQPHMCVQDTLLGTQMTCFINVMSWSKIGVPSEPNAPIPLYGAVKVPISIASTFVKSPKEMPLVFAVVVNPLVLKQSGKLAQNVQERDGLIDLILDFIETMNDNIRFTRNFKVLKDRDLTGELKDIWTVIQAKRDAEKGNSTNTLNLCLPDENVPAPIGTPVTLKWTDTEYWENTPKVVPTSPSKVISDS